MCVCEWGGGGPGFYGTSLSTGKILIIGCGHEIWLHRLQAV